MTTTMRPCDLRASIAFWLGVNGPSKSITSSPGIRTKAFDRMRVKVLPPALESRVAGASWK